MLNSTFLSKFAENRIAYAGLSVGLYNILCWQPCRPTKDECKQSVQDVALVGYIVPCYDVLHTFSKDYIMDDLIGMLKKKGALS